MSCMMRAVDAITSEATMGEWEFYRIPGTGEDDAPYHWAWKCRHHDGSILSTGNTFRFLLDCVAHARLHGYSNGPLLTRREPPYGFVPRIESSELHSAAGSA